MKGEVWTRQKLAEASLLKSVKFLVLPSDLNFTIKRKRDSLDLCRAHSLLEVSEAHLKCASELITSPQCPASVPQSRPGGTGMSMGEQEVTLQAHLIIGRSEATANMCSY